MPEVDLTPNAGTAVAAQRGLDWLKEGYGGDGLVDATIADARKMAAREALSEEKVRKMPAWFARHEVDMSAPANSNSDDEGYPGPGAVAWARWGGDAGRSWSEAKLKELEANADRAMPMEEPMSEEPMLNEPMLEEPEEVARRRGKSVEDIAPAAMLRARKEADEAAAAARMEEKAGVN